MKTYAHYADQYTKYAFSLAELTLHVEKQIGFGYKMEADQRRIDYIHVLNNYMSSELKTYGSSSEEQRQALLLILDKTSNAIKFLLGGDLQTGELTFVNYAMIPGGTFPIGDITVTLSFLDLVDTPNSYSIINNRFVTVNDTQTGLNFTSIVLEDLPFLSGMFVENQFAEAQPANIWIDGMVRAMDGRFDGSLIVSDRTGTATGVLGVDANGKLVNTTLSPTPTPPPDLSGYVTLATGQTITGLKKFNTSIEARAIGTGLKVFFDFGRIDFYNSAGNAGLGYIQGSVSEGLILSSWINPVRMIKLGSGESVGVGYGLMDGYILTIGGKTWANNLIEADVYATVDATLFQNSNFLATAYQTQGPSYGFKRYGNSNETISGLALYHKDAAANDWLRLLTHTGEDYIVWHSGNFDPADVTVDLSNYVTLDSSQTITGLKNFTTAPTISGNTIYHSGNSNSTTTNWTAKDLYAQNWIRTKVANVGLNNEITLMRWYSETNTDYTILSFQPEIKILFQTNYTGSAGRMGGIKGVMPSNEIGFTNTAGGWRMKVDNDGNGTFTGGLIVQDRTGTATMGLGVDATGKLVETALGGGGSVDLSNYVTLNTAQTITGVKTFSSTINAEAIYTSDPNLNNGDGSILLKGTNGLRISGTSVATFRLLPSGNDIYFQNTAAGGNVHFTGLNAATLTGDINFKTTGKITLPMNAAGFTLYGTADQTTNYERYRMFASASGLVIQTEKGGSGTNKSIALVGPFSSISLGTATSGVLGLQATPTGIAQAVSVSGNIATGMVTSILHVISNINQTGSGGYRGLFMSLYHQAVGTGNMYFIDVGNSSTFSGGGTHTSKFNVDSNGNGMFLGALTVKTRTGTATMGLGVDASGKLVETVLAGAPPDLSGYVTLATAQYITGLKSFANQTADNVIEFQASEPIVNLQGLNYSRTIAKNMTLQWYGGSVGISVSPTAKLHVVSVSPETTLRAEGPNGNIVINHNNTGKNYYNANTSHEFQGGNVGIGVETPTEKLHVGGNVKADGDLITLNNKVQFTNGGAHYLQLYVPDNKWYLNGANDMMLNGNTVWHSGNSNLDAVDWRANSLSLMPVHSDLNGSSQAASIKIGHTLAPPGVETFIPALRQGSTTDTIGYVLYTSLGQYRTGAADFGAFYIGVGATDAGINRFFHFYNDGSLYFRNREGAEVVNTFWHSGNSNSLQLDWQADDFYAKSWFRNTVVGTGLYNEVTQVNWMSENTNTYTMQSSINSVGILMKPQGVLSGIFLCETNGTIGFLNGSGVWSLRTDSGGNATATEYYRTSSKKEKRNIQDFEESALDILRDVDIKTYNLKASDAFGIGFIAEDTHPWLSGVNMDSHNFGNHLAILTKAIQEEDDKVTKLENRVKILEQQVRLLQECHE